MSKDDRINSLQSKHASLDEAIHNEHGRPYPNSHLLTEMKLQKLRIKEEIGRLSVA